MITMTSNDEDLLPENYQKHKKNILDCIKKKYGLTDEEAENYYYLDRLQLFDKYFLKVFQYT